MYVCIYVCIYIYMDIYGYIYICVCGFICMNVIYTYILFIYLFIYLLNKYIELNSVRKGAALRNSAKFTGKHLCQRLFFNRPEACNFIKKRLWRRSFPVSFAKFLRTSFLTEHFWATASDKRQLEM